MKPTITLLTGLIYCITLLTIRFFFLQGRTRGFSQRPAGRHFQARKAERGGGRTRFDAGNPGSGAETGDGGGGIPCERHGSGERQVREGVSGCLLISPPRLGQSGCFLCLCPLYTSVYSSTHHYHPKLLSFWEAFWR